VCLYSAGDIVCLALPSIALVIGPPYRCEYSVVGGRKWEIAP